MGTITPGWICSLLFIRTPGARTGRRLSSFAFWTTGGESTRLKPREKLSRQPRIATLYGMMQELCHLRVTRDLGDAGRPAIEMPGSLICLPQPEEIGLYRRACTIPKKSASSRFRQLRPNVEDMPPQRSEQQLHGRKGDLNSCAGNTCPRGRTTARPWLMPTCCGRITDVQMPGECIPGRARSHLES